MIRVGVIGLGAMGKNHARVYSELSQVDLVGVADLDFTLASNIARVYHTKPFSHYHQLLEQGIDAVSIAVDTSSHKEIVIDVANRGVNILVEKPIADTVTAAEEIIKAAHDNKVKLMVGHIERFNPVISIIKREIEGAEILLIETTRIGPFPPRVRDIGVVIDLAVHDIDLIRYLTGSEFQEQYSLVSKFQDQRDDVAIMLFRMASGVIARCTVNWITPFKVREISIATSQKFIRASLIEHKISEYSAYPDRDHYLVKEFSVPFGEPLKFELEAFIESVANNTEPPITGIDGLEALKRAVQCLIKEH